MNVIVVVVFVIALFSFGECMANGLRTSSSLPLSPPQTPSIVDKLLQNDRTTATIVSTTTTTIAKTDEQKLSATETPANDTITLHTMPAYTATNPSTTATKTTATAIKQKTTKAFSIGRAVDVAATTAGTDITPPSPSSSSSSHDALVLIQSTKHIKLKHVRDQFQQFIDMFGVKLYNVTIDFDIIDGKCFCVQSHTHTHADSFIHSPFSSRSSLARANCIISATQV